MSRREAHTDPPENADPLEAPEAAALTPAQLEELKARAAKADEDRDRLMRMAADFDNFKKRAAREKQDAIRYANEGLLEMLIPVLDTFDMAIAAALGSGADNRQSLRDGIAMIHQQLRTALADTGLEEIDAAGQVFDPNVHEAVSERETDAVPEGRIFEQLRKGYKLRDRLLRPATVVVARHPAGNSK